MKLNTHLIALAGVAVAASVALGACSHDNDLSPHVAMSADIPSQDHGVASKEAQLARNDPPDTLLGNEPPGAGMPSMAAPMLSASEQQFLIDAANSTQYELAVAQLAKEKAADSAVKSYGAMVVGDQTDNRQKLLQLAQRHQILLPSTLSADKQKVIDQLSKANGRDFDRQFIQTVGLRDHKDDISLFEKASHDARDNEVREFASNALPTLRAHLSAAQNLPPSASSL